MKHVRRRGLSLGILGTAALVAAMPLFAQREHPDKPRTPGASQEQEIAQLMQQGQLSLTRAVQLAESYTKGVAVSVKSEIHVGEKPRGTQPGQPGQDLPGTRGPNDPAIESQQTGDVQAGRQPHDASDGNKHVIFTIACVVDNNVRTATVNAKTSEVEVQDKQGQKDRSDRPGSRHPHGGVDRP